MTAIIASIMEKWKIPAFGICPFSAVEQHLLPCRAAKRLPAQPRSIIVTLFPYRFPEQVTRGKPRNLSRYACVPDYHIAVGNVLKAVAEHLAQAFPQHAFVPFVDNSPIPEVAAAALAGLGVVGDHGLLIHPRFGSFVFIGTMVTDLALPPTGNPDGELPRCDHCGRCGQACPGSCLPSHLPTDGTQPQNSKPERCLSAISQKKGALTPEEQQLLKKNSLVWGCDTCQEVCPHNAAALRQPHPCFTYYQPWLGEEDIENVEGKAYGWRGPEVLQRNLRIVADTPPDNQG